ncbi:MAG: S9 family peptidase, partial [Pseudomonadota bacterium]
MFPLAGMSPLPLLLGIISAAGAAAPAVTAPNENLIVDGLPPIPAAIAESVAPYTEFRSAPFVAWHPTRREMLVTTRFADTAQLHRVTFPGGARRQLTFFADRVTAASYPPCPPRPPRTGGTAGDAFVFSKDTGGDEFFQNYRHDPATGITTLLTDGKSRNSLGVWSNAGDRLAYTSTRRNRTDTDLYLVAPADAKTDHLLAAVDGGGWAPLDWSPDDRTLLVSQTISINESHLWLFDAASGARRALTTTPPGERVAYRGGRWARDGKSIFVAT